jgi:hypothetical protein
VQDEGKTVVDLGDEFIGFGGNQGERLKVCSIRPLLCVPNAGEGERARLGQSDVEDALDGLGRFCFPRRFGTEPKRSPETVSGSVQSAGAPVSSAL